MKVQGSDVILSIDELQVAAAQACELDVQQEFISICAPHGGGRWKRYKPSTIGWTASINMLIVAMDDPQAWLNEMKASAQPLTMRYYDKNLKMYQKGEVWIANWHNGAQVGSLATFSVQLQGNGELKNVEWTNIPMSSTLSNRIIHIVRRLHAHPRITIGDAEMVGDYVKYDMVSFSKPTRVRLTCSTSEVVMVFAGVMIPSPLEILTDEQVPMFLYPTSSYPETTIEDILPAGNYIFMRNKTDMMPLDIKAEKLE